MSATLEHFKDQIIIPLLKTIEQAKGVPLGQFTALNDVVVQWGRKEGMEISMNHVISIYNQLTGQPAQPEPEVEIIPPQQ